MNIAILTWGISTERGVALRSGENMKAWIEKSWHTVRSYDLPLEIDEFLAGYRHFDLIVPVFHGRYGEDGIVTGMCETLGLRVAGCPSHVHALCIDKYRTNCVVEKLGVRVPRSWMPWLPPPPRLLPSDDTKILEKALIVKPNQWGSSLATTKAKTREELEDGMRAVDEVIESLTKERVELLSSSEKSFTRYFPPLTDLPLVQECIEGREFTVGVYRDESGTQVLPIIEILTLKGEFFDYEEKYETDGSNEVFTNINPKLRDMLESQSSQIYDHLGCWCIVRIDWRYDGDDIYFLEVNTIPGFTSGSLVPKMWKKAGKSEEEFLEILKII
jgi:D-alanine-D-alanine ligase